MTQPPDHLAQELRAIVHAASRTGKPAPWAALDDDERAVFRALAGHVAALIAAAKAEEREACAKAVEQYRFDKRALAVVGPGKYGVLMIKPRDARAYYAAAIRSRTTKEDHADG